MERLARELLGIRVHFVSIASKGLKAISTFLRIDERVWKNHASGVNAIFNADIGNDLDTEACCSGDFFDSTACGE